MRAMIPYPEIPGDNAEPILIPRWNNPASPVEIRPMIMTRSGDCLGMTETLAVWRFGFRPGSEAAGAYGVSLPEDFSGFVWVLATRKTGKVKEIFNGFAFEIPAHFRKVIS